MNIDKKTDTAIKHFYNYFKDNQYDELEALQVIALMNIKLLERPVEDNRKFKLNRDSIFRDFKDYLG